MIRHHYFKSFQLLLIAVGFSFIQNCELRDSDKSSVDVNFITLFDTLYSIAQTTGVVAMDIQQIRPEGFIIGGSLSTNRNNGFLLKISESGEKFWERTYPGISRIFMVRQAFDDGFYAAGDDNDSGACLLKTNIYGEMEWYSYVSFPYDDGAIYARQLSDNNYIIAVNSYAVQTNCRIVKIDPNGQKKWVKEIITDSGRSVCFSIHEESGNLKLFCGNTDVSIEKGLMIILDQDGSEISRNTLDNKFNNLYVQQRKSTVIEKSNGGFAGCGFTSFIEFDHNGSLTNYTPIKPAYFSAYDHVYARSLVELSDGTFLVGGCLSKRSGLSNAAIFKIDDCRKVKWQKVISEDVNTDSFLNSIISVGDSCFVMVGWYGTDGDNSTSAWVKSIKILSEK